MIRTAVIVAVGLLVLTTCAVQDGGIELPTASDDPADGDASQDGEPDAATCELAADLDAPAIRAASASLGPVAAVTTAVDCADQAVVVPPDDPVVAAIAAPLAVSTGAPLLVGTGEELTEAIAELGDPEVRELARDVPDSTDAPNGADEADGTDDADDPVAAGEGGSAGPDTSASELALEVADELGRDRFVAVPADAPDLLAGAAAWAVRNDAAVLPLAAGQDAPSLPDGAEVVTLGDVADVVGDLDAADSPWDLDEGTDLAWLVDPADPAAVPTVALAALRGDGVIPVPDGDLLARRTVERVRGAELTDDALLAVGQFAGDPAVQVTQLAEAPLLPGGGLRLFDGTRMVALYGTPGSTALGVLGEQDLDATVARVREVAQGYDADGREVVPAFEIIVTVASNSAGDSYSNVAPPERFEEWVDRAEEEGIQVILDLQPGRVDFLTQARIYEDLLRRPHVGLALDPEWRLEDDQEHLEQIGGVDAAEVQEVVDWLAELTREEGQTSKLLVLHQFRLSMLRDRDTIEVPPEIAAVVHADGQGPQAMKLDTWRVMTEGAEDRWLWGWKNFYDEDPVVAGPDEVLALDPEVVLVTYQ